MRSAVGHEVSQILDAENRPAIARQAEKIQAELAGTGLPWLLEVADQTDERAAVAAATEPVGQHGLGLGLQAPPPPRPVEQYPDSSDSRGSRRRPPRRHAQSSHGCGRMVPGETQKGPPDFALGAKSEPEQTGLAASKQVGAVRHRAQAMRQSTMASIAA